MKTTRYGMAIIAFIALALPLLTAQTTKNHDQQVLFNVNMTCGNCVKKIEKNIPFERGVKKMKTDLETKTVKLTFDSRRTNIEKLQAAFTKIGMNATVAKESTNLIGNSQKSVEATAVKKCSDKASCADKKKCSAKAA